MQEQAKYRLFFLCDQGSTKHQVYNFLGLNAPEEDDKVLGISIGRHSIENESIQIYDFPGDRVLLRYYEVYLDILPAPNVILYFINQQASVTEIQEWMCLLDGMNTRIAFISTIETYQQRQALIVKLSHLFRRDIIKHIFFINIEERSLATCIANLDEIGISLQHYVRKPNVGNFMKWCCFKLQNIYQKNTQSVETI